MLDDAAFLFPDGIHVLLIFAFSRICISATVLHVLIRIDNFPELFPCNILSTAFGIMRFGPLESRIAKPFCFCIFDSGTFACFGDGEDSPPVFFKSFSCFNPSKAVLRLVDLVFPFWIEILVLFPDEAGLKTFETC